MQSGAGLMTARASAMTLRAAYQSTTSAGLVGLGPISVRPSVMSYSKRYFSISTTARTQALSFERSEGRGPIALVM